MSQSTAPATEPVLVTPDEPRVKPPRPPAAGRRRASSLQPPVRGVPLGIRLGLTVALVVVGVVGVLTFIQQQREIRRDRSALQAMLAEALSPLARDVEHAASIDQIRERMRALESTHTRNGRPLRRYLLQDSAGRVVASSLPAGTDTTPTPDALTARLPVTSPLLPGGVGELIVAHDGAAFRADVAQRWRAWWLDLLLAGACIAASLQLAIHFIVVRPLGRLMRQLKKMEAGYIVNIEPGRGAWEIRWLGWHFHRLGLELSEGVRRLVSAERRALRPTPEMPGPIESPATADSAVQEREEVARDLIRRYLRDRCRVLESLSPGEPFARVLAEEAWTVDVVEAERLGEMDLRAQIENLSLRLLHPDDYALIERQREALIGVRDGWAEGVAKTLESALAEEGVRFLQIQYRIKHIAGIWRKMKARQLAVEDVQDIFAFRIIVPEEQGCYQALRAVHNHFEPEPFRFKDYIAEPKENGYRSLHTAVRDRDDALFEVQIRSLAMHRAAERGRSAHWRYIGGKKLRLGAQNLPAPWVHWLSRS